MKKLALLTLALATVACGAPTRLASPDDARLSARSSTSPLDAERALAHVRYLTEPKLAGRMTATEGDELTNAYLVSEFRKLGLSVALQPFTSRRFTGTAYNVIALLPGERTDRFVVVGAHKDHLGKRGSKVYYGANDNAGGTAGVLEIARVMADRAARGDRPRSNVMFMAFSGEELGLIGSTYYTKNPVVPGVNGQMSSIPLSQIAGMVNLDCIAVGRTDTLGTDWVGTDAKSTGTIATIVKRHGMTPVYRPFRVPHGGRDHAHDELPPGASSDHAAFRRAGVRAICYYAEPVFSKYLHTPYDTLPERDEVTKKPIDQFNVSNLVRIGAVGLDTATTWANE